MTAGASTKSPPCSRVSRIPKSCSPSTMPRSLPKTSGRLAGSCGRARSVNHFRCRDHHGPSRLDSLRFSGDGCAIAIACGHYPSIPTARVNPWLTTNGISSWPRYLARSSISRRRSSAIASTAIMSLAGPRPNGPWAHAYWQDSIRHMALRPPVSIGRAERDHPRSGGGHISGALCPASRRWRRCLSPPG